MKFYASPAQCNQPLCQSFAIGPLCHLFAIGPLCHAWVVPDRRSCCPVTHTIVAEETGQVCVYSDRRRHNAMTTASRVCCCHFPAAWSPTRSHMTTAQVDTMPGTFMSQAGLVLGAPAPSWGASAPSWSFHICIYADFTIVCDPVRQHSTKLRISTTTALE